MKQGPLTRVGPATPGPWEAVRYMPDRFLIRRVGAVTGERDIAADLSEEDARGIVGLVNASRKAMAWLDGELEHEENQTMTTQASTIEAAPLHVYTAESEEWVIASSPADAAQVYKDHVGEAYKPNDEDVEWVALPSNKTLAMHDIDDDGVTHRLTCAEWVVRQGRSYLGSASA